MESLKNQNEILDNLKLQIQSHIEGFSDADKAMIMGAVDLAISLHSDQQDRPDGPYVNHVLRVAERIAGYFGIRDLEVVVSGLLHDSVEDQAGKLSDTAGDSEVENRKLALEKLKQLFGELVSEIVNRVTNSVELDGLPPEEKNKKYAEHIGNVIHDPKVFYVKLSDFMDNGLNIYKIENLRRRKKLAEKYLPIYTLFIDRIKSDDITIPEETKQEIISSLESARAFAEQTINGQTI